MPYQWLKMSDAAEDIPEGGAPSHRLLDTVISKITGHFELNSEKDDKNVRLNSRNYYRVASECSGVQTKPSARGTGTSTVSMCGLEASPRFQDGIAGENLIAIKADPILKAGTGNLSGGVCGVQVSMDFGISGTRTITGEIAAFEAFLAIPSTYSYSAYVSFLRVRNVNIKGWDYFLNVQGEGTGLAVIEQGTYTTADGYLKVRVGSNSYEIPIYLDAD